MYKRQVSDWIVLQPAKPKQNSTHAVTTTRNRGLLIGASSVLAMQPHAAQVNEYPRYQHLLKYPRRLPETEAWSVAVKAPIGMPPEATRHLSHEREGIHQRKQTSLAPARIGINTRYAK